MKITKKELQELNACKGGYARFIKQTNSTDEPVDVASLVGGKNTCGDLLWLAGNRLTKERIVRFACDCALINIGKIKKYINSNDYILIVEFLRNPAAVAAAVAADVAAAVDAVAAVAAVAAAVAAYADDADDAAAHVTEQVNGLLIEMFNEVK